jgi:bifunctional enzyme CysN/CysC
MSIKSNPSAEDVEDYRYAHQHGSVLGFITCGGESDGKSTLIGRLLRESKRICEDQPAALQEVTIGVAYRFFETDRRKFIVADASGDEQYTRSMVTAASTVDLAVILVDAGKGVLTQTRRHSYIVSLLGIRKVILAVSKMDQVGFARGTFDSILDEYLGFAKQIGLADVVAIPISALNGDNVTESSPNTPWYQGPTLVAQLESIEIDTELRHRPFRMPVQSVNHADQDSPGLAGTIVSGTVNTGDRIRVLPSGKESRVARIVTPAGDRDRGLAGQSVALTIEDEIEVSRGDLLVSVDSPAGVADQFQVSLIWMHEEPMLPGRPYLMKIGACTVEATVTSLKYKVNVNTLEHLAAKTLDLNEIGVCNLGLDRQIPFDRYVENRATGSFVLIDRLNHDTVGAGLIQYALRRAENIHWQALDVNRASHAKLNGQKPCILWFTGLSGAGKSTIANLVEKRLFSAGKHTYLLDGDNVRHGLNKDLGFTDADRVENIRRVAEVARLMVDAGLIVLVSFISPFRSERRMARDLVAEGEFFEVYVDTPLAEAEKRDPKGLYRKARRGELKHFTGIDSPYEAPEHAEIRVDTVALSPDEAADLIVARLAEAGIVSEGC